MADMDIFNLRDSEADGIPEKCVHCGGELDYTGLGEYTCRDCGRISYDNYGRVRNYIERNPGATAIEVARVTGVSKPAIKRMIDEGRIQRRPYSRNEEDDVFGS